VAVSKRLSVRSCNDPDNSSGSSQQGSTRRSS
jgi:hypothetical protein